jgi:23S rRNA pseudouridine2605 synthase
VKERVQKLMAQADIGSRRACEDLIREGRVRVNGEIIELGSKADPQSDIIEVDGEKLQLEAQGKIYIAFNKPVNVLSTNKPQKGDDRRTVRDMVTVPGHLFMVGRLDAESQGLMVLTNDGDLANRLTHPRYQHTKTYRVTVYGQPDGKALAQWQQGVHLPDEGRTAPCSVRVVKSSKGLSVLEIVMTEGKKRQIRRVAAFLSYPVRHLTRTHIGRLSLGSLHAGEWRELDANEIQALLARDPAYRDFNKPRRRHGHKQ